MTTPIPFNDFGLCAPWFTKEYLNQCCKATRTASPAVDSTIMDSYIMIASEIMYYWLARQFRGACEMTFRPRVACACGFWGSDFVTPADRPYSSAWGDGGSGGGTGNASCTCGGDAPQVDLGLYPVTKLKSIHMFGADLNPALFHIDEYRYLVANNGAKFPIVQNIFGQPGDASDVGPDHWIFQVSVNYGTPPPELAKRAAARLACELLQRECMDVPCQLPDRVISYVRQGVSAQVISPQDILNQGLIGILEIDLAIRAYNPAHLQSSSFVWSPDLRQGGRRTHTS